MLCRHVGVPAFICKAARLVHDIKESACGLSLGCARSTRRGEGDEGVAGPRSDCASVCADGVNECGGDAFLLFEESFEQVNWHHLGVTCGLGGLKRGGDRLLRLRGEFLGHVSSFDAWRRDVLSGREVLDHALHFSTPP